MVRYVARFEASFGTVYIMYLLIFLQISSGVVKHSRYLEVPQFVVSVHIAFFRDLLVYPNDLLNN